MKNSVVRRGGVIVRPNDFNQLVDWMESSLKNRSFKVVTKEEQFAGEPFTYNDCRLANNDIQSVRYFANKMHILFILEGPDDISVPVGGFGKLVVTFSNTGFLIENKGVGTWEFIILGRIPHKVEVK